MSFSERLRRIPRRRLVRLAVQLAAGSGLLAWTTWRQMQTGLIVENRSGQPVAQLQVSVGNATASVPVVPGGEETTLPAAFRGGGAFTLEGRLADGTRIKAAGRAEANSRFIILPGGEVRIGPRDRE
jgi:hypothetical protein